MNWLSQLQMPGRSFAGDLPSLSHEQRALTRELRQDLVTLSVSIGERHAGRHKALEEAVDFIDAEFCSTGLTLTRLPYEVDGQRFYNLELRKPGAGLDLVVGAHYDSVPGCPAANDNGTGVVALLALARRAAQLPDRMGLRLVAFANEEPPYFQTEYMGSWVYARGLRRRELEIQGLLALETIGYYSDEPGSQAYPAPLEALYPKVGNFIAFVGNLESAALVHQAIGLFRHHGAFPSQGLVAPEDIPGVGYSDQFGFWQEGYQALMITDTAPYRYPYYHTPEDTIDKIDFEGLTHVVSGLQNMLLHWDSSRLRRT